MKLFYAYDKTTGEIKNVGAVLRRDNMERMVKPELAVVEGVANQLIQRYDLATGMLVDKEEMMLSADKTTALVDELITVSGLPVGSAVVTEEGRFTVDDGVLELEFARAGTYTVSIDKFPYLRREMTFEITD
jgi:hypothetical protein